MPTRNDKTSVRESTNIVYPFLERTFIPRNIAKTEKPKSVRNPKLAENWRVADRIKLSTKRAVKMRDEEASKYTIPYIKDKEIRLTTDRYNTGKISTNLLDSIYDSAVRVGLDPKIALGLAGRESTLGIGRGFKRGESISSTDLMSNWQQITPYTIAKSVIDDYNSVYKKYNSNTPMTKEEADKMIKWYDENDKSVASFRHIKEHPIDNALKFYMAGKYNPGDKRHTQMVEEDARILMTDPAIQKWYKEKINEQMKCGGRRKAQLGLDVREGGIAIPIANNMFYIKGRKHSAGGVAIGPNNKNGVEVEGDEVVQLIDSNYPSVGRQFKAGGQQQTMRVFSSVPLLRGVSPAQLVLQGYNPDDVFKAQEDFKDRNHINDDGTTYKTGGLSRSSDYGSKKKPYPSVKSSDFAGGRRSYPIPTKADAIDALRLAGLHGRSDVKAKVYRRYPELRKKAEYGIGMIMPPNITISKLIDSIKFDREKIHNRIPAREWKPGGQSNVDKDVLVPFGMFSILNQYYNNNDNVAQKLVDEANKIISNPWSSENEVNDAVAYLAHDDAKSKYLGFPQRTGMVIDSNYKPTKAKDKNTKYYKFAHQTPEYWDNQNGSVMQDLLWQKSIGKNSKHYIDPTLNEFTGYIATDPNKGDYISIYDKWDYNKAITGGGKDNVAKHIPGAKPFEIYDRIYLDNYYGINTKPKKGDYYGGYLPEVEVKPKKKKYGGNMIYEINGNVKNGLMSLRPKAQFGKEKKINSTTKIGADGLIYTWGPDGEWYTDGTRYEDSKYYMREKSVLSGDRRSDGSVVRPKQKTQSLDELVVTAPRINKQEVAKLNDTPTEVVEPIIQTTSNTRPQFYTEKRMPMFGEQSLADKMGLARSGWSYGEAPTISGVNENVLAWDYPAINYRKITRKQKEEISKIPNSQAVKQEVPTNEKPYTANVPSMYDIASQVYGKYIAPKVANGTINLNAVPEETKTPETKTSENKDERLIGQYKKLTPEDWIGLGSNVIGSLANYFINKNTINKMPMPSRPAAVPAAKLKTRFNINAPLSELKEAEQVQRNIISRNTQSSNVSRAAQQRVINQTQTGRNQLYTQKENIETQLINQDRLNRQSVAARNIASYNDWMNRLTNAKINQSQLRSANITNLISGLTGGVTDILGRIENRRATNNALRAYAAANPNVDARIIGGFDYYRDAQGRKYDKNGRLIG